MINRFQPALVPIKPAFRPWVLAALQSLLPLLLRLRIFAWLPAAISRIEVEGEDKLVRCWHRFGTGQVRLILAFRHVEVDDPLVGLHLLSRVLPDGAARLGLSLPAPLHAHFLFDRGMTLWAGRPLGWLLASLGGVSLRRGRQPDWTALRQARQLVLRGAFRSQWHRKGQPMVTVSASVPWNPESPNWACGASTTCARPAGTRRC
jgi:hypothetical protein